MAEDRKAVGQGRIEAGDDAGQGGPQAVDRGRAEPGPPAGLGLLGRGLPDLAGAAAGRGGGDGRVGPRPLAPARVGCVADVAPAAHAVQVGAGPRATAQFGHRDPLVGELAQAVGPHQQGGEPGRASDRAGRGAVVGGAVREAVLGLVVGLDREGDQRRRQQGRQREGRRTRRRPGWRGQRGRGGGRCEDAEVEAGDGVLTTAFPGGGVRRPRPLAGCARLGQEQSRGQLALGRSRRLPAGRREEVAGLVGGELRPGGLAEPGHPLLEAGALLRRRGAGGDAHRQLAAVGRDLRGRRRATRSTTGRSR